MRSLPAGDSKIARPEAEPLTTSSAFHVPPACAAASRAAEAAASPSEAAKSLGNAAVQSRPAGGETRIAWSMSSGSVAPSLATASPAAPDGEDRHPGHVAALEPA